MKILGLLLIAAGTLGLIYGGVTYTKKTRAAKIGSFELAVKNKETVEIPIWASVGAIVVGGVVLATRKR